jgi:hypothetical protein
MQTVTILNSGTTGATIAGQPGFGPWEVISDVRGRLASLVRTNATALIVGAHQIESGPIITVPSAELRGAVRYRQRLGPVSPDPTKGTVAVTILFEVGDPSSNETTVGEATLQCR